MAPFLSVVTRHIPERALMLALNRASLDAQSVPDYEHVVLVDDEVRGIPDANDLILQAADKVCGDYVLILDDDNVMIDHRGIEALKKAAADGPPAIICRGWYGRLGVLPGNGMWGRRLAHGHIGSFGYVLRRDVFVEYVAIFAKPIYHSDYLMIDAVQDAYPLTWTDRVLCAVTQIAGLKHES